MSLKIAIVGGADKELESTVRACGSVSGVLPLSELQNLAQPSAPQPDVIVLDLRGHAGVPPGLNALKRQHQSTGVVIVAKALDPEMLLSAIRSGANECVAEPVTQADLDAAITRVVARQTAPAASQLFALVGAKGGTGTTSLAVNLAASLARLGTTRTLLIDLHVSGGDAALYLGVEPRFSVTDALDNIHKLDEAFFRSLVAAGPSRLDVLAAPAVPVAARLDGGRVKALLDFTAKQFQYVVVDVPRTEPGALDALEGAKTIVVVATQELPAVRSAATLAARLRTKYGKDRVHVVMMRADRPTDIESADVEQALGAPLAATFPSDYQTAITALNKGRPFVLDNHTKLASSLEQYARQLAGVHAEHKQKTASGWFTWPTARK